MIEKLNWDKVPTEQAFQNKIDEIIDWINDVYRVKHVVNDALDRIKVLENSKTNSDAFRPNNRYTECKKWIGSLVEYGDGAEGFRYGILTDIKPTNICPFIIDNGRNETSDCWLPSETLFYKKEQQ